MKLLALLGLFLMPMQGNYPVQVQILNIKLGSKPIMRRAFGYNGTGVLQVIDSGSHPLTYSFEFLNCTHPDFNRRLGRTNYPGRWEKHNHLVLFFPSHDGQGDECTLKLTPLAP